MHHARNKPASKVFVDGQPVLPAARRVAAFVFGTILGFLIASAAFGQSDLRVNAPATNYGPVIGINGTERSTVADVFTPGEGGYGWSLIPGALVTQNGTILALAELRDQVTDGYGRAIGVKQSFDHGKTWGPLIIAVSEATTAGFGSPTTRYVSNACPVQMRDGTIAIVFNRGVKSPEQSNEFYCMTAPAGSEGAAWNAPVSFTSQVFGTASTKFTGTSFTIGNSGTLVKITKTAHGMFTGYSVKLSGCTGTDGAYCNNGAVAWTITVVDANNFTLDTSNKAGVSATSGTYTAYTQNELLGVGSGLVAADGKLWLCNGRRYCADKAGLGDTVYPGMITTSDLTTWSTYIWPESTAANNDCIEGHAVETSPGNILTVWRNRGASGRPKRSVSTNGGTTFGTLAEYDGTGGLEAVANPGVLLGLLKVDASTVLLTQPNDGTFRTRMTAHLSSDLGLTWRAGRRRLFYGTSAYSIPVLAADGTLCVLFERGHYNAVVADGTGADNRAQIACARIKKSAIVNSAPAQLDFFHWDFNQGAAGTSPVADGATIMDRGPFDARAAYRGAPAFVTGQAASETAISLTSASTYVVLSGIYQTHLCVDHDTVYSGATVNNGSDLRDDGNLTFECLFKANATNGVIYGGPTTGKRQQLEIVGGKLKFTVADGNDGTATAGGGTNPISITGGTTVNDNTWRRVMCKRDKAGGVLRLYVESTTGAYVSDATAVTDSTGKISNYAGAEYRLGQNGAAFNVNGTNNLVASFQFARFTRGSVPIAAPDNSVPKNRVAPARLAVPTIASDLNTISPSNLKLYWGATHDETNLYADLSWGQRYALPAKAGAALNSTLDRSSLLWKIRARNSLAPQYTCRNSPQLAIDTILGKCWDFSITGGSGPATTLRGLLVLNSDGTTSPTNNFDWFIGDGTGLDGVISINCFLRVPNNGGANQTIFDNHNGTGSNPGITFYTQHIDATHYKLGIQASSGGGVNATTSTSSGSPGLLYDTPYHILWVSTGTGSNKMYLYSTALTSSAVAPTVGAPENFGSFTAGSTTHTGSVSGVNQDLAIGYRFQNLTQPFIGRIKYFAIWNVDIMGGDTANTNKQTLCNLWNKGGAVQRPRPLVDARPDCFAVAA